MARQGLRRRVFALAALLMLVLPASAEARYASRTLKVGSTGSDVRQLQSYLTEVGLRTSADGQYGRATASNVRTFERQKHLRADGRATPSDQRALKRSAVSRSTPASTTAGDEGGTEPGDDQPQSQAPPPSNSTGR